MRSGVKGILENVIARGSYLLYYFALNTIVSIAAQVWAGRVQIVHASPPHKVPNNGAQPLRIRFGIRILEYQQLFEHEFS